MIKTKSHSNGIKYFIALLICCSAFMLPGKMFAQSGTTCSGAITIIPNSTTYTDSLQMNQLEWFTFQPTTSDIKIVVTNLRKTQGYISSIQALGGTCSGLYAIADSAYESTAGDSLTLNVSGLNSFETYWIKLRRGTPNNPGVYGPFTLKIRTTTHTVASCSCTSLFPYDSTSTCQAVCNGGFDLYTGALSIQGQIERACPWRMPTTSPSTTIPSADLFNSYNSTSNWYVPTNGDGTQGSATAPIGGIHSGYAGIYCYYSPQSNIREYITVPLNYTLINSKQYKVTFKVSLADNSGYAVNNIGAYFTNGLPTQSNNTSFNLSTSSLQAYSSAVITNDAGWTTISGVFTASGNMNYLTIGQMTSDANETRSAHTPASSSNPTVSQGSYYYIDDVSVLPYPDSINVVVSPSTPCNGDTVNLYAQTNVTGAYYFTWLGNPSAGAGFLSNHNDTVRAIPSDTVLYTSVIHLPNYNGCTINDTATVHWKPGPIHASAGTDVTTCLGGQVTLTGTLDTYGNYGTWTTLSNTVICSNCTTATIYAAASADYVFISAYSSSPTACKDRDTVHVTGIALMPQIVSSQGFATCDPNFIPFMTNPSTYSTWSWSTNAPAFSGVTNDTLMAKWNSNAVAGTVNVTVTDANGCVGYGSLTVPVCCTTSAEEVLVNTNTTATYSATTLFSIVSGYYVATSRSFNINGDFHVNANTKIVTSTVKFGPNAKIIIDPGYKLVITGSNLYSCSDMWDGIYVDGTNSTSEIIVNSSSSIQDAKNAIVSTRGGKFTIDGTAGTVKLNKNNIGILVKPYQSAHPGTIKKAIISCDNSTQPGGNSYTYTGNNCRAPVNGKSFCAIYVDSCLNLTIGDSASNSYRNTMERQKYGIYTKNSTVKVWNNDLKYYTASATQKNSPVDGVAIYAKGSPTLTRTLTVGRVGNYKAHNKILKVSYGVMVENSMNLNCEYNRIDSASIIGVYALNNQIGKTILINMDSITEFSGTGINCTNVKQSTVTITKNQLNETSSSTPTSFAYTGIYVANAANFTFSTVKIQTNTIKRVRNGIWVMNVTRAQIMDNNITFYPGQVMTVTMPAIGIKMEAAHSSLIRNNIVLNNDAAITTGSQLSSKYDKLFGIHVTNCINDTVTKNTITKCGSGLFLKGSDNPCLIGCNIFQTCYYGVNFGYSNSIQTSVITSPQFRWGNPYTGTITPTGNTWPSNTFNEIRGKVSPAINWYYNSSSSSPFPATTPSIIGITLTSTTNANQCTALLNPITTGTPSTVRNALLSSICKTPTTYDTLNSQYRYQDSLFAFRTIRDNSTWTSLGDGDDSYYSNWYSAVASTNIGKMANVEDSIKAGKLTGAISLLNTVTPHGTPENNRKTVLGIYLVTWAKDSMNLDSLQIVTLTAIAKSSPISGGIGVYDARAMLFLEVHDSSALRLAPEHGLNNGASLPGHIYPNPSTGTLMLNYELPEGQTGVMQLYDLTGRIVHRYPLVGGMPIQQFDASDVPAGLYFYSVIVGNEAILSEKLIIIRQE
jgi:parallel beta-helix repeat protein